MKRVLTALVALTMAFSLVACGGAKTPSSTASTGSTGSSTPATSSVADSSSTVSAEGMELRIGQTMYAAHGTKSFAVASVVLDGDKIVKANIDEYQFLSAADATGVPNADGDFAEGFADKEKILASKVLNDSLYSTSMTEKGEATITLANNFKAVEDFVIGKTVAELGASVAELEVIAADEADEKAVNVIDVVAGCTLVDAHGYINSFIEAANVAAKTTAITAAGTSADLKFGKVEAVSDGTRGFAITTALVQGDVVLLSTLDEFQCMDVATTVGVPNSAEGFNDNFVEGQQLVSKRVNDVVYSENMTAYGEATLNIAANFDGVVAFVNGKTLTELEAAIGELEVIAADEADEKAVNVIDVVADCTLHAADKYVAAIVSAAKAAK